MHKLPSHDLEACHAINYNLFHIIFIVILSANSGFILIFLIMAFLVIIKISSMYGIFFGVCVCECLCVLVCLGQYVSVLVSVCVFECVSMCVSVCL